MQKWQRFTCTYRPFKNDKDLPVRTGHSKYEKVSDASPFDEFYLLEICAGRRFARRTGSRFSSIFFSSNHNVNLPMPWRWVCHRARMRWYARAIPDMRKSLHRPIHWHPTTKPVRRHFPQQNICLWDQIRYKCNLLGVLVILKIEKNVGIKMQ